MHGMLKKQAIVVGNEIVIFGAIKPNNQTSGDLLLMRPSCNPGMRSGSMEVGKCPIAIYSTRADPSVSTAPFTLLPSTQVVVQRTAAVFVMASVVMETRAL
jgi:hypothetical protein